MGVHHLLGRHVGWRAEDVAFHGESGVLGVAEELGYSEVGQLWDAVRGEQDVVRLDVAVYHAVAVRERESVCDLGYVGNRLLYRKRAYFLDHVL